MTLRFEFLEQTPTSFFETAIWKNTSDPVALVTVEGAELAVDEGLSVAVAPAEPVGVVDGVAAGVRGEPHCGNWHPVKTNTVITPSPVSAPRSNRVTPPWCA
ncbi:MAG TPA: hypothetical protein DCM67_11960 [Propionibacteriaceae bacterium]|nr:hypothetical protein [Propionibacteriaceae bacterium]